MDTTPKPQNPGQKVNPFDVHEAPHAKPASEDPALDSDELRMPLWQHLDELRSALVRVLVILALTTCAIFSFIEPVVLFLETPLLSVLPPGDQQLYFTGIADKFIIYIQISVLVSIALLSPYLLFELWRFVSPALYRNEKRFVLPFLIAGSLSFVLGISFAYWIVIPYSYDFLINFGSPTDKAIITLTSYFSMTVKMLLGMGLLFQMPVCITILGAMGFVSAKTLANYRRYAALAICVISAIITPSPDALTMVVVSAPLYLLYEISILGVRWIQRVPRTT